MSVHLPEKVADSWAQYRAFLVDFVPAPRIETCRLAFNGGVLSLIAVLVETRQLPRELATALLDLAEDLVREGSR